MVAKISFGSSLYGALAYNGEKINKEEGKLLATNKIFDDCSGKTSIANALRDFQRYLSPHIRTEKPVVHISLNPHPDDVLTDMDMENIAREYLERMGYGNQPYMVYKHEDIDRHHMHIVTIRVDENGKCLDSRYNYHRSKAITHDLEEKYNLHKADRKQRQADNPLRKVDVSQGNVKKQVANTVCFFINADMVFTKEMYPKDLHCPQEIEKLGDIPCRGGSCVVDPYGHYVTQPVWDKEEIIYADLDMQQAIASRMEFDGVGHYARPDVLELRVHE